MSCCQIEILPNDLEIDQLRKELVQARWKAHLYKELHQRNVKKRERIQYEHDLEIRKLQKKHKEEVDTFQKTIEELKAKLKLRERQLFGRKSEKAFSHNESLNKKKSKRPRGQQRGKKSPPKRKYPHLPVTSELQELPEEKRFCPCCHAVYEDIGATEDSDVIEINVQAHIRRIKRKKYRRSCNCQFQPVILTAPQMQKIFSKSRFGNSVWIHCLMQKFWHGQPLHRVIQGLSSYGLSVSAGTIIGGFFRLLPLFRAIYQSIMEKSLSDKHWHADETGWKVFESLEGKANNRWFLWIFRSNSAAIFIADPSRSAQVVSRFFGKKSKGIISCDRYSAYFCFVSKAKERFLIAYCWVHVRRDFLSVAKDRSEHEAWAMDWVFKIRHLYHINNLRIRFPQGSLAFLTHQKALKEELNALKQKMTKQLEDKKLPAPCRKALESLERHWHGLTTFVEYPEVPMDNNTAERGLRGGVVGRKNYYGSGSIRSAEFTAIMFSIIQTLLIWNINPQVWFGNLFDFMGSDWSKNFNQYLPWNMSSEKRTEFSFKKGYDPPS